MTLSFKERRFETADLSKTAIENRRSLMGIGLAARIVVGDNAR
jgi:hypothetical protein